MSKSSRIILTDIFGEYASNDVNWEDWDQLEVQPDGRVGRSQGRNTRSNRTTVILTDPDGEAAQDVNWEDWDQVAITPSGAVVSPNYDASSTRRSRANPTNSVIITDSKGEF